MSSIHKGDRDLKNRPLLKVVMKSLKFWVCCFITIATAIGLSYWLKNPMDELNKGIPVIKLVQETVYEEKDGEALRTYHDLVLDIGPYGLAKFTVSLPEKIPEGGLPTALVVNGLDTGRKCLKLIQEHGNAALIAFEYPSMLHKMKSIAAVFYFRSARRSALAVPGQLVSIARWAQEQSWHDKSPVSTIGFSLGAEFLPAALHLACSEKVCLGPAVLAYGGAGLFSIFYAIPGHFLLKCLRAIGGAILFHPLEPEKHLPHIQGEFLLINGIYDQLIPLSAAKKMQELFPEPKTIINLETEHVKPNDPELLGKLIRIARDWLEEKREKGG